MCYTKHRVLCVLVYCLQIPKLIEPSSQNHRMVWVGIDLEDPLVPMPLPCAGILSTSPGYSEPIQPGLKRFQGWGIHNFPRQIVLEHSHPHSKEFFS